MSRFDDYTPYIQSAMESWSCPGVAIAVVQGDQMLYQQAFGLRDVENKLPMTADTRFAMASCTKSFTAMSVALLVDDGKLEWDKPVIEYMPEFVLDDLYVTRHLTVRDMLSHRTGLPRHDFSAWRLDLPRGEYVKRMKHLKFSATFREKFQYNNLMYYVTPYLVEKLAGMKWEDFVQQRIFDPLGMRASNFQPDPPQPGQVTANGYRVDRDEAGAAKGLILMPFKQHSQLSPGAAGALFSTLADLIQWLKVHINEGQAGETRIVSPGNLKQMHLPHTIVPSVGPSEVLLGTTISTYGMGWSVEPYRGYTLISHGGNVEGHSLVIGFVPQGKVGVVALTNIAGLPLRDALLFESVDRALDLPEQDWNKKWHGLLDPLIAAEAKGKLTSAEERVPDAPPTHPLETFAGTYEAKGYPDFDVRLVDGALQAHIVDSLDWSELKHYHYNVFEWYIPDFDHHMKLRFLMNDNGEIDSASLPLEPAVENIVFTRKALEIGPELTAALLGEYASPVEGFAFTVTAHEGKFYIAPTGSPADEIKAYRLDEGSVGFRF